MAATSLPRRLLARLGVARPATPPKPRPKLARPVPLEAYDASWRRVEAIAERVLASGESELSRALHLVEAESRSLDAESADGIAYGRPVRLPRAALWGARQALRMQVLIAAARPDTRLVVELGSGWGSNLLGLHLAGGPLVPYYALELTEPGRRVAERLARLEPRLELETRPFDLRDAVYDIPPTDGHVLAFTSHSIEQVPELPAATLTRLFGLGRSLTVVHFEPIGWQVRPGAAAGATREYSQRMNYNLNLWNVLRELESAGEITIDAVEPDLLHHKPGNASTLVIWRRG